MGTEWPQNCLYMIEEPTMISVYRSFNFMKLDWAGRKGEDVGSEECHELGIAFHIFMTHNYNVHVR